MAAVNELPGSPEEDCESTQMAPTGFSQPTVRVGPVLAKTRGKGKVTPARATMSTRNPNLFRKSILGIIKRV